MGTLADAGFKLTHRPDGGWQWRQPHELTPSDTDCTDMNDDDFEAAVRKIEHGTSD
jgi:hypothetical protein